MNKPTEIPTETTPYIWAQEYEAEARAACGCKLDCARDGPALYRCENCIRAVMLHDAQQRMIMIAVQALTELARNPQRFDVDLFAQAALDKMKGNLP